MKITLDFDLADVESLLATKYQEQVVRQLTWTVGSYDRRVGEKKYYLNVPISRVRHAYLWKDLTVSYRTYNTSNRFQINDNFNLMEGVFHSWDEIVSWCVTNNIRFDTKVKLYEDQYGTIFFKKDGVAFGPQFPNEAQAAHWMKSTTNEPWLIEGSDPTLAYGFVKQYRKGDPTTPQLFAQAFHMKQETWEELLNEVGH